MVNTIVIIIRIMRYDHIIDSIDMVLILITITMIVEVDIDIEV
jgi:hypothetical protein